MSGVKSIIPSSIDCKVVINEDVHVELLELLELYCELLLARFGLLDQKCKNIFSLDPATY